jgi:hypothetical protein
MRRTMASRGSNDGGLAPPPEPEPGTLVVYSARTVKLADDVNDVDSRFAPLVTELIPGGFRLFFEVTAMEFRQLTAGSSI